MNRPIKMEALALIVGIGIVCFLLLYFAFRLDKEHIVLKFTLLIFFIFMLVLIPKAMTDYEDHCDFVVKNITTSAPVDHYEYDYICSENDNVTSITLLKGIFWLQWFFVAYFITYLFYVVYVRWKAFTGNKK